MWKDDPIGLIEGKPQAYINERVKNSLVVGGHYKRGRLIQLCDNFAVFKSEFGYTDTATYYDLYAEEHKEHISRR